MWRQSGRPYLIYLALAGAIGTMASFPFTFPFFPWPSLVLVLTGFTLNAIAVIRHGGRMPYAGTRQKSHMGPGYVQAKSFLADQDWLVGFSIGDVFAFVGLALAIIIWLIRFE